MNKKNVAYTHCTLLDGTENMLLRENMTVLVENGVIVSVRDNGEIPDGYEVVDLTDKYLMPGLINMHVHIPGSGKPKKNPSDTKKLVKLLLSNAFTRYIALKLCEAYAKVELYSGVTTLRTVGGIGNIDTRLRNKIKDGKVVGPRILASNMGIGTVGGHMVGTVALGVADAAEAVEAVKAAAKEKVDLIKLMITGGVLDAKVKGEPGVLKMDPAIAKAACDEAHILGLAVAAHVESSEGVRVAIENGVDTIEHGAPLDEHMVALFKERKAAYICTLSPAFPMAAFDREVTGVSEMAQYNSEVVLNGIVSGTKTALANGIPVGLGTDTGCPYITHYDMWRELHYYVKMVGVTPTFALYSATLGNARIAKIDNLTGSVEVGKAADFLITDENPLTGFATMRKPYMVVAGNRRILKPQIKKYAECEEQLDAHM